MNENELTKDECYAVAELIDVVNTVGINGFACEMRQKGGKND